MDMHGVAHAAVPANIQTRGSARSIVDPEFIHPTFAEGVQSLVMPLARYALDFWFVQRHKDRDGQLARVR